MVFERCWQVIGGAETGGLLVREGYELSSRPLARRLGRGAVVQELELRGDRLYFGRLFGEGPGIGWISVSLHGRRLVREYLAEDTSVVQPSEPVLSTAKSGDGHDGSAIAPFGNQHAATSPVEYKKVAPFREHDRSWLLGEVCSSADALKRAPKALRSDSEVVYTAVSRHWQALEWASEDCRADRDIVLAAAVQSQAALKWAPPSLQADSLLRSVAKAACSTSMFSGAGLEGPWIRKFNCSQCLGDPQICRWRAGVLELNAPTVLGKPTVDVIRSPGVCGSAAMLHVRFPSCPGMACCRLPMQVEERRLDPQDGRALSLLELRRNLRSAEPGSEASAEVYWDSVCKPLLHVEMRSVSGISMAVWEVLLGRRGAEGPRPAVTQALGLVEQAVELSRCLRSKGWGFVDAFLPGAEADLVQEALRRWWTAKQENLPEGAQWDPASTYEFLSLPEFRSLGQRLDLVIEELRREVPQLADAVKLEGPMLGAECGPEDDAVGKAGPVGSWRHVGTLLVYFNPFWCEDHGGQSRLYPNSAVENDAQDLDAVQAEADAVTEPFVDVEPLHGRLLAFLSRGRAAHRALPARQPRLALTYWLCSQ